MLNAVKIDTADYVSSDEGAAHRELERWIDRHGSSAMGGRLNLHNVYGNGQQVAGLDEAGKLDVLSRLTAFSNSDSGRTQVTVQARGHAALDRPADLWQRQPLVCDCRSQCVDR